MKKVFVLAVLSAMLVCSNMVFAKKTKTFEGTVTYRIGMSGNAQVESSIDMLPDIMKMASLSVKGSKSRLSLMGQQTFIDNEKKILVSQVDLSMLGMGSFCIESPFDQTYQEENAPAYKATGETKKIGDYTAEKYLATTLSNDGTGTTVESEIWITRELGISNVFPNFPGLEGFPLEFEISAAFSIGTVKVHLTLDKVTAKKLSNDDVSPDSDCPRKTMEELQDILKVLQNFGSEDDL